MRSVSDADLHGSAFDLSPGFGSKSVFKLWIRMRFGVFNFLHKCANFLGFFPNFKGMKSSQYIYYERWENDYIFILITTNIFMERHGSGIRFRIKIFGWIRILFIIHMKKCEFETTVSHISSRSLKKDSVIKLSPFPYIIKCKKNQGNWKCRQKIATRLANRERQIKLCKVTPPPPSLRWTVPWKGY